MRFDSSATSRPLQTPKPRGGSPCSRLARSSGLTWLRTESLPSCSAGSPSSRSVPGSPERRWKSGWEKADPRSQPGAPPAGLIWAHRLDAAAGGAEHKHPRHTKYPVTGSLPSRFTQNSFNQEVFKNHPGLKLIHNLFMFEKTLTHIKTEVYFLVVLLSQHQKPSCCV